MSSDKIPDAYARHYESDDRSSRKDNFDRAAGGGSRGPSLGLSSYYKERFGDQSPEEYQNLRLSHMSKSMSSDDIRDTILAEFARFGPFEVKIVHNPEDNQRLAYVNFEQRGAARKARKECLALLSDELGRHLKMDPAGVVRDQEGRRLERADGAPRGPVDYHHGGGYQNRSSNYQPQRNDNRRGQGYGQQSRRGDFNRGYGDQFGGGRGGHFQQHRERGPIMGGPSRRAPKNELENTLRDPQISRTLFIGNLAYEVRDRDLVRAFERFGRMGSIEIKRPVDGSTPYAFVTFEQIENALETKKVADDEPLVKGGPRMRIGWAKGIPQQRLWVHGLGDWATEELIYREFDRYGVIEKVEFVPGADKAYITFDSIQSATDACAAMKDFPLGGKDRVIRVDFACPYECLDLRPANAQVNFDPHNDRKKRRDSSSDAGRKRGRSSSDNSRSPKKTRARSPSAEAEGRPRSRSSDSRSSEDNEEKRKRARKERKHLRKERKMRNSHSRSSSTSSSAPSPRHSRSPEAISASEGEAPRDISPSRSPTPELAATDIEMLQKIREPVWQGVIVLKKSAYPVKLYTMHCENEATVIEDKFKDSNHEAVRLHITQRLPWMANNLQEKFGEGQSSAGAAYFLAVPNEEAQPQIKDLAIKQVDGLVAYLNEKAAAGVVSLSGGSTLYTFPKSLLAEAILNRVAPKIAVLENAKMQCLLLALAV